MNVLLRTLLISALLLGCSAGAMHPDRISELEIRVVRGPIEPVQREGEENVAPVAGARVLLTSGGRRIATIETGRDGAVVVPVRPGDYQLQVSRCPAGTLFAASSRVSVPPNLSVPVTLVCDTGIR